MNRSPVLGTDEHTCVLMSHWITYSRYLGLSGSTQSAIGDLEAIGLARKLVQSLSIRHSYLHVQSSRDWTRIPAMTIDKIKRRVEKWHTAEQCIANSIRETFSSTTPQFPKFRPLLSTPSFFVGETSPKPIWRRRPWFCGSFPLLLYAVGTLLTRPIPFSGA